MTAYNAIILGGGRSPVDPNLPKGNTPFNDSSLAGQVYEAVSRGYEFNRIALVMNPDKGIDLRSQDVFVEPTFCKGAWLSGYNGIKAIDDGLSDYVVVAGDLPFLNNRTVQAFMQEVISNSGVDVLTPLIPRETNERRFPNRKRTYQPLQEGEFLAGNMGYLSQKAIRQNKGLVEEIASSYQQKMRFIFKAIAYLGLKSVLRSNHPKLPLVRYLPAYERLFPKFSIKELEEKASEFMGVNIRVVDFPYPECAFDIDRLEQLHLSKEMRGSEAGALEALLNQESVV